MQNTHPPISHTQSMLGRREENKLCFYLLWLSPPHSFLGKKKLFANMSILIQSTWYRRGTKCACILSLPHTIFWSNKTFCQKQICQHWYNRHGTGGEQIVLVSSLSPTLCQPPKGALHFASLVHQIWSPKYGGQNYDFLLYPGHLDMVDRIINKHMCILSTGSAPVHQIWPPRYGGQNHEFLLNSGHLYMLDKIIDKHMNTFSKGALHFARLVHQIWPL